MNESDLVRIPIVVSPDNATQIFGNIYQSFRDAVLELIQNGIDAVKDTKEPSVDVVINLHGEKSVTVEDNGCGISPETMAERMRNIANSPKRGRELLGEKGIGLFAFFGKAKHITITSIQRADKSRVNIDRFYVQYPLSEAAFGPDSEFGITPIPDKEISHGSIPRFNTRVEVGTITCDTGNLRLSSLVRDIEDRYGEGLRVSQATVRITLVDSRGKMKQETVNYKPFTGDRFRRFEHRGQTISVVFDCYKPKISEPKRLYLSFRGSTFRLEWDSLKKHITASGLLQDLPQVITAFDNGWVTGVIQTTGLKLADSLRRTVYCHQRVVSAGVV